MSEAKTIPKPLVPKPDGLEDQSGLDGTRQDKSAKTVLPAVCHSHAHDSEETVKLPSPDTRAKGTFWIEG